MIELQGIHILFLSGGIICALMTCYHIGWCSGFRSSNSIYRNAINEFNASWHEFCEKLIKEMK